MKHKIDSLTGLRFLAALIVLVGHLVGSLRFPAIHAMGGVSVQLFFVLSGFVMYLSYQNKLGNKQINFKKFILFRVIRLYPAFSLIIIGYSLFVIFTQPVENLFKHLLIDLTFTQSWWGNINLAFTPLNGPSWSVSTEFFFYIVFYFVFRYIPLKVNIYVFLFYFLIWLIILFHFSEHLTYYQFLWLYYVNPYFRFCDFLIGCFFAILYLRHREVVINSLLMRNSVIVSVIEVILLILLFGSQYIFPYTKHWWILSILNLVCGLIIVLLSLSRGVVSRILSTGYFVLLGEASYSLYLVHVPLFDVMNTCFNQFHVVKIVQKILLIFLPIVTSIIIYKYLEYPINKYLRRLLLVK